MDVLGRPTGHIVAVEDRQPIITEWSGMTDWDNCPPDYETWARQYLHYTRFYVSKYCSGNWIDDVVQEIMERFQQRDSLGVFSRGWETRSASGKSRFRSYYIRFVVTYAPGKNRNYVRRNHREALIADAPLFDDSTKTTWLDSVFAEERSGAPVDPAAGAEFAELASQLQAAMPSGLTPVIDALISAALTGADLPTSELAAVLGCSKRTASAQLAEVRETLLGTDTGAVPALLAG